MKHTADSFPNAKRKGECVDYIVNMAEEAGYKELQDSIKKAAGSKKVTRFIPYG